MNTAPEILFGVAAVLFLAALVWATTSYAFRNRALDRVGDRQASRLFHDRREAPVSGNNGWIVAVVVVCAVALGGLAIYSYKVTGWMQQVAESNGTTAGPRQDATASAPDTNRTGDQSGGETNQGSR